MRKLQFRCMDKMCDQHDFDFDVDTAFRDQLVHSLESRPLHPLAVPEAPRAFGIYALYKEGSASPVYVGQAVGAGVLNGRLRDHQRKIQNRMGISLKEMTCRYLVLKKVWEIARAEEALIAQFKPGWNGIPGFSMHVPGIGRPGKEGYVNEWDRRFPPHVP